MTTENEIIDVCAEIGGVAESNCHYTAGLARLIDATGKTVDDLTVRELIQIITSYRDTFNRIHSL